MKVLILNCGSSSIKYQLVETSLELIASNADRAIARAAPWSAPGRPAPGPPMGNAVEAVAT
jgi:hypothetical protein